MATDNQVVLAEIDAVLSEASSLRNDHTAFAQVVTLYSAAIERLAPPGSQYVRSLERERGKYTGAQLYSRGNLQFDVVCGVEGILKALRGDYAAGRLRNYRESIHSDLSSDFLEIAEHLLSDENLKDPAAVMAGGVIEEHLRAMCDKNAIATTFQDSSGKQRAKKLDTMNADLAKKAAYGKNDQKQVTAWASIRNDAAHANYANYTDQQVALMIQGVRDFIARYPA